MKSYKPTSLLPKVYPKSEHALDQTQGFRVDGISLDLEIIKKLANPYECPIEFLPLLAYTFGSDFYWELKDLNEVEQREMIANSLSLHQHKGTRWAIEKVLSILGIDTEIIEWWEDDKLLEELEIKPTNPYTFAVVIDVATFYENSTKFMSEDEQRRILKYLLIYKNVRSHFDMYLKVNSQNNIALADFATISEIDIESCESEDFAQKTINDIGAVALSNMRDTAIVQIQNRDEEHILKSEISFVSNISISDIDIESCESKDFAQKTINDIGAVGISDMRDTAIIQMKTNQNEEVKYEMNIPIIMSLQEVICL